MRSMRDGGTSMIRTVLNRRDVSGQDRRTHTSEEQTN